jgi:hypothetical protein
MKEMKVFRKKGIVIYFFRNSAPRKEIEDF